MKEEVEDADILLEFMVVAIGTGDIEIVDEGSDVIVGLKLLHSNLSALGSSALDDELSKLRLRNKFGERRASSELKSFVGS